MSIDYRVAVIGKCWNEKEYSIKGDFWCNQFRDIWDDLEYTEVPDQVEEVFKAHMKTKLKDGDNYQPETKTITLTTLKSFVNEKKEALEREKTRLTELREDRAKSTNAAAFENFTDLISSSEQMIAYYQEECIDYVQALIDGLSFYSYTVLDLTGEVYFTLQAWW